MKNSSGTVRFLLFLWYIAATAGNAAEIDAAAHINKIMETKPLVMYQREEVRWEIFPIGVRIPHFIQVPYLGPAKASNSYVAEVTALTFDRAKLVSLPEVTLFTQKQLLNCADTNISSTVSMSLTGSRSWGVSKTDGVSTTVSASATGNVGVPGVGSGSLTLGWNQAISTSTTKQESFQDSTTRVMSDTITIGPKKAANVSLLAYQATIEIPYRATVVVDGDLVGSQGGPHKASALLSRAERTLPLAGTIRLTDVSEATVRTDELHGQAGCDGNSGKLAVQDIPQSNFRTAATSLYLKSGFSLQAEAPRTGSELGLKSRQFALLKSIDDGPSIGPPDGTSYEVMYTAEVARPAVACGFNDLGIPHTGVFSVEARQYRTYVGGKLVSQYQTTVEVFKNCFIP